MLNSVGDLEDLNEVFPNKEAKENNDHNIEKSYHKFVGSFGESKHRKEADNLLNNTKKQLDKLSAVNK